jgi:type II secretion system protein C
MNKRIIFLLLILSGLLIIESKVIFYQPAINFKNDLPRTDIAENIKTDDNIPANDISDQVSENTLIEEQSYKLELLGTAIGSIKDPIAYIKDLETNKQGIYKLGGKIKEATVIKIVMGEVVLENHGKTETLRLSKHAGALAKADDKSSAILYLSDDKILVNRKILSRKVANVFEIFSSVKIKPYYQAKEVSGMVVDGITQNSVIASAGIKNNDVVTAVNGQKISSYQKALQILSKIKGQSEISVSLLRNGQVRNLNYRME